MQIKTSDDYKSLEVIKRLYSNYVKKYLKQIIIALVFMIVVAICTALIVSIIKPAIDDVFIRNDKNKLFSLSIFIVTITVTKGFAEYFQSYMIKSVGQRILSDLQIVLYSHLINSDIYYLDSQSAGKLISRFTNDIMLIRGAVSNILVGITKHFFSVVFLIILMFNLEFKLSFFVFFVFPIAIYPVQKIGRKMRVLSSSAQEELGNYTAKLDETFNTIKILKSFQAEKFEVDRASKYIEKIYNIYKKSAKFEALTSPIMETLSSLAIGAIIILGGHAVMTGTSTPGSLLAFIGAFISAYRPFKSLLLFNNNLQEGIAAAKRLFDTLDNKPIIENETNKTDGANIDCSNIEIKFENVELKFNSKIALQNLNLVIKAKNRIALVGKSGEGKTSIANLLLRFYDTTSGVIKIGDINIMDINLANLRKQIALVTQDTMLFDATVHENIAYSIGNASRTEIEEAAKKAQAHDFICKLPEGYETIIGSQGKTLSGGQRQRIAIARAFLKNAPILVLDEATSSLDPSTEQDILQAIKELCFNRTTIIITHRLNTIKDVDMIYLVKNGKIVESGTHEKLIKDNGHYYELYNKQNYN